MQPAIKKATTSDPQKEGGYIDLPPVIKTKKAVINVKNKDNRCFEYAISSALHRKEIKAGHQRPSKYKEYLGKLDFTDIEFPVSLKDTDNFEKQNLGIGVNVFGYEKDAYILRINKTDPQNAIDLIFVTNADDVLSITNEEYQHYCWIKNFSRLVSAQRSSIFL